MCAHCAFIIECIFFTLKGSFSDSLRQWELGKKYWNQYCFERCCFNLSNMISRAGTSTKILPEIGYQISQIGYGMVKPLTSLASLTKFSCLMSLSVSLT